MNESWYSYCDENVQEVGVIKKLEFHETLNAILAITDEDDLKIFDANTGIHLQETRKRDTSSENLQCCYHKSTGGLVISDGQSISYRSHSNGVLLVNNALQEPIKSPTDTVTLELPLTEARLLTNFIGDSDFSALAQEANSDKMKPDSSNIDAVDELLKILVKQISSTRERDNMTLSGKWATVNISLPYSTMKSACHTLFIPHQRHLQSLERRQVIPGYHQSRHQAYGLPIVSSLLHQLVLLFPEDNQGCHGSVIREPSRKLMYAELTRRATFTDWPHADYKYALPHAMAQAGFFHQPASTGEDRAMCFACNVCLVCWEPSDEPWSEHERHSPSCPFVCCEPTVNVPISVSHATQPAASNPFGNFTDYEETPMIDFISVGKNSNLLTAASKNGFIAVWDVSSMIPQVQSISTISKSNVLYHLRRRLLQENFPEAEHFVSSNYVVSNLTITSLSILDKLPADAAMNVCDPQEFLVSSSTDNNHEISGSSQGKLEAKPHIFPPILSKTPAIVVGVTFEVNPRPYMGIKKQSIGLGIPKTKKEELKTFCDDEFLLAHDRNETLPSLDTNLEKNTVTDSEEFNNSATTDDLPSLEGNSKEETPHIKANHKFSLLLFLQPEKHKDLKKIPKPKKQKLSMSKTTLFHPQPMEGVESYPPPDIPITNGVGSVSIPSIPKYPDNEMHKTPLNMNFQEVQKFLPQNMDDFEQFAEDILDLEPPDIIDLTGEDVEDPNVDENGNITVEIEGNADSEIRRTKMTTFPTILQLIVLDCCSQSEKEDSSSEENSKIPANNNLQVADKILMTDDGHDVIVSSHMEKWKDMPVKKKTQIKKDESNDYAAKMQTHSQNEPMKISEDSSTLVDHEHTESVSVSTKEFDDDRILDDDHIDECDNGKLFVFAIEPSHSIHCVTPKAISSSEEGKHWIKTSRFVDITLLPPEFGQSQYEDDDIDSLDDEEDDESMKDNKKDEKVGKSDVLNNGNSNSAPSYMLGLASDGTILVLNLTTLKIVFTTSALEIFSESGGNMSDQMQKIVDVQEKFTAFVYCSTVQRLCAASNTGKLAFLKIGKHSDSKSRKMSSVTASASSTVAPDEVDGGMGEKKKLKPLAEPLLVDQPLTTETLKALVQLTKSEPLQPRFTATAPVCWTEVPIDQDLGLTGSHGSHPAPQEKFPFRKQGTSAQPTGQQQPFRRHLRHPNEHYSPDSHSYTRAWRLQPDCLSWSEHLFELVFPRPTNLSHIDLKFVLGRKLSSEADIQITLLKHPGLTTSKNEILRNEQRRKWRHHGPHYKSSIDRREKQDYSFVDTMFPKVMHLLTEGFVDTLMEEDIDNPVLLVVEERKSSDTSDLCKEFIMMDGSQQTIIAICKGCPEKLSVGQLVVIKRYMRVKVGMSSMRIIVAALRICSDTEVSLCHADELKMMEEDWSTTGSNFNTVKTENNISNTFKDTSAIQEVPSEEESLMDNDIVEEVHQSLNDDMASSVIDGSEADDNDGVNQDGSNTLFGPVNLSDYTDASGIGGVVTITSRGLVQDPRHRAVLILIEDASAKEKNVEIGTHSDEWRKKGCNRLQEISITVSKAQRTNLQHERMQRHKLLCCRTLHEELLNGICQESSPNFVPRSLPFKTAALDILNWVGAMEAADPNEQKPDHGEMHKNVSENTLSSRYLSSTQSLAWMLCFLNSKIEKKTNKSTENVSMKDDSDEKVFESKENENSYSLKKFLKICFLDSGRDVSVRALYLIFNTILCVNMPVNKEFQANGLDVLSNALLDCLEEALERKVESAHGLYCLFQILSVNLASKVQDVEEQSLELMKLLERCVSALSRASTLMKDSLHPIHAFLRTNYGLYGTPFDPERFTVEFVSRSHTAAYPSGATPMAATENALKQQAWEKYFSNEELNIQDLVTAKVLNLRRGLAVGDLVDGLSLSRFGLLDCQPLHFTCVDASEGCNVGFESGSDSEIQIMKTGGPVHAGPSDSSEFTNKVAPGAELDKLFSCYKEATLLKNASKSALEKMEQDIATKRSLPDFMDSSDTVQSESEERSNFTDKNTPVYMTIPNLSFDLPPVSVLTVSRMHSGARRSVVLDFGHIVELTDVHIPSCQDLSYLVLDAWSEGTKDTPLNKSVFTHVGVTLDICDHDFVLSNMVPAVICRYVRITVTGRYGTTNAQSCVSLGRFYGRSACVGYRRNKTMFETDNTSPSPPKKSMKDSSVADSHKNTQSGRPILVNLFDLNETAMGRLAVQRSLAYMKSYQDDVECRYGLACNQLQMVLSSSNMQKVDTGLGRFGDFLLENQATLGFGGKPIPNKRASMEKLFTAYKKCSRLQVQMNRVTHAIQYLNSILGCGNQDVASNIIQFDSQAAKPPCFTQLQTYCELMLNTLLSLPHQIYFSPQIHNDESVITALVNPNLCTTFFQNLICNGNPRVRVQTTCFLLSYSSPFPWWGGFVAKIVVKSLCAMGKSAYVSNLPREHLFSTLLVLGQRCLATAQKAEDLTESLLNLIKDLFHNDQINKKSVDVDLLTWIMLYATHLIETIMAQNECFLSDFASQTTTDTAGDSKPSTSAASQSTNIVPQPTTVAASSGWNEYPIETLVTMPLNSSTVMPSLPSMTPMNDYSMMLGNMSPGGMALLNKLNSSKVPMMPKLLGNIAPTVFPNAPPPQKNANPAPKITNVSKEAKFAKHWKFISLSEDCNKKQNSDVSGYMKILRSMQAIHKRLKHHKAELIRLNKVKNSLLDSIGDNCPLPGQSFEDYTNIQVRIKAISDKAGEHLRGIVGFRRSLDRKSLMLQLCKVKPQENIKSKSNDALPCPTSFMKVSVEACRSVVQNVLALLLQMDVTIPSDFVVLACKLSSQLCRWCSAQCVHTSGNKSSENDNTSHPLFLSTLLTPEDLKKLLILATGGTQEAKKFCKSLPIPPVGRPAGPWVNHSLLSLLQDIVESENTAICVCETDLYPEAWKVLIGSVESSIEDTLTNDKPTTSQDVEDKLLIPEEIAENESKSETLDELSMETSSTKKDEVDENNTKNEEHEKRLALVDTYISNAEEFINDIKLFMKAHGEDPGDAEGNNKSAGLPPVEQKEKIPFPTTRSQLYKRMRSLLKETKTDSNTSKKFLSPAKRTYVKTPPVVAFRRKIRRSEIKVGKNVQGHETLANRLLLCSNTYDCRSVHGVSRQVELTLKLCTMSYLKLVSRSITHPPTMVIEKEKAVEKDIEMEEGSQPPQPLSSFRMLRSCVLDILKKATLHSIPLTSLCEVLNALQSSYDETLVDISEESKEGEFINLMSLEGASALLTAINGLHGSCFHDNPQIWSHSIRILDNLLRNKRSVYQNIDLFHLVLDPDFGLVQFLVNMLTTKMAASNIGIGSFNQPISLLGPSICSDLTKLLDYIDHNSTLTCEIFMQTESDVPNLIVEYKDMLMRVLAKLSLNDDAMGHTSSAATDAQLVLIEALRKVFTKEKWSWELRLWDDDMNILLSVVRNITRNAFSYLQWSQTAIRGSSDNGVDPRSCMSGLFASLITLPTRTSKVESPRDSLMLKLLQLCADLVWVVLPVRPKKFGEDSQETASPESDVQNNEVSMDVDNEDIKKPLETKQEQKKVKSGKYKTFRTLADCILQDEEIMELLLSSLVLCNGSAMASLFTGFNLTPAIAIEKTPVSTGDGVFLFLTGLVDAATNNSLPLRAVLKYMTGPDLVEGKYMSLRGKIPPTCQLSVPLLWFILHVFESSSCVTEFCELGGARLIADSFVASAKESIDLSQNRTSQILRYLSSASERATAFAPRPPVVLHSDTSWPSLPGQAGKPVQKVVTGGQGFSYNDIESHMINANPIKVLTPPWKENKDFDFAAVASISCSDPAAQSAESLLKPKAVHRRARSPSWSYNFASDVNWVALIINFPTAFILKKVKLIPTMMSLSTTPSAVMLEMSSDGSSYHPVSVPLATSGMSDIVIHPPSSEVVNSIKIYMQKPVDSFSLGLTRIIVNGVPTFMNYDHNASTVPFESICSPVDKNRHSTMNWLTVLHYCMTIDDQATVSKFCQVMPEVPGLIPTLCALLHKTKESGHNVLMIENVLLLTGKLEKSSELINCILKGFAYSSSSFIYGGMSGKSSESTINLIYTLCQNKTDVLLEQILREMLNWILKLASSSGSDHKALTLDPTSVDFSHVHAIACGLWSASDRAIVKNCLNLELTKLVYKWSKSLPTCTLSTNHIYSPLKSSLNCLMCSFCHIDTENYEAILNQMGLLDSEAENIMLTSDQISTSSAISQTPECVMILLAREILLEFSCGLQKFCGDLLAAYQINHGNQDEICESKIQISLDNVIAVINFFSDLSALTMVQEWLGSEAGAKTWQYLLKTLYYVTLMPNKQFTHGVSEFRLPRHLLLDLEESTIALLKGITLCNDHNQKLFTKTLCDIVSVCYDQSENATQLTGFVRSLLLRVVLEEERYTVHFVSGTGQKLQKGKSNSSISGSSSLRHPMFGTGHLTRTFEVAVSSDMKEVWSMASDAPMIVDKIQKQQAEKDAKQKKNNTNTSLAKEVKKPTPPVSSAMYSSTLKHQLPSIAKQKMSVSSGLIDVLVSGKNAQTKRKRKLGNTSSAGETSQNDLTNPMLLSTIELKCPDISTKKLEDGLTILQILAMRKARNVTSFALSLDLEFHVLKDSKSSLGGAEEKKENDVPMETSSTKQQTSLPDNEMNKTEIPNADEQRLKSSDEASSSATETSASQCKPMKTMLEVFASLGGLAFVAQRLPTVAVDLGHASVGTNDAKEPDPSAKVLPTQYPNYAANMPGWMEDEDWFAFDDETDFVMEQPGLMVPPMKFFPPPMKDSSSAIVSTPVHPCIPVHTMSALCLFLRIPHFGEEFLSEQKQARCLLRLMLGVQDDGQGEQILKLELAQSLPMLPFTALCSLLSHHGPASKSGITVREAMTFDTTSIHLILACLSRFTHSKPNEDTPAGRLLSSLLPEEEEAPINVAPPSYKGPIVAQGAGKKALVVEPGKQSEKNYWAPGTGFGTGSTTSDWDVGNAVKKQKKDEGYITVLLEVLANFVCPESKTEDSIDSIDLSSQNSLPMEGKFALTIPELLHASGLIPAIASYLRNDSVLDMAHHVPLYKSLLSVIRSFAVCPVLCRLLMDSSMTTKQSLDGSSESSDSILSLLTKMRKCIDTYASRLKSLNTSLGSQGEEGLTSFVLNVQKTEAMLKKIADKLQLKESEKPESSDAATSIGAVKISLSSASLGKLYLETMKNLQFDTAELVLEEGGGKLKFPSGHHYSSQIRETANVSDASRARRLAQETVTLSNSLPLSYSSTVFVRCDEVRLDVMKVLITGPSDTPYSNGCFEFDVFFPTDYNKSPPLVNLKTTGNHSVRFNPNLYNDGKVCLSILNTWHGRPEEKWSSQTSSFLQILVSIQSLILVAEPYFNEPGYERSRGTPAGKQSSREYDSNIQQATVKWAMLEQLRNPSACFKDVIEQHFWLKRTEILNQCDQWLSDMKQQANDRTGRRSIAHNYTALQRHVTQLKSSLENMKCPEGLKDIKLEGNKHSMKTPEQTGESSTNDLMNF